MSGAHAMGSAKNCSAGVPPASSPGVPPGMAGRFPKARNIDEFWRNLSDGVEAISFFSDQELAAAGVGTPKDNPNYVKARGVLDDAGLFDAGFFGINPREAEVTDPQHRVFLEEMRRRDWRLRRHEHEYLSRPQLARATGPPHSDR